MPRFILFCLLVALACPIQTSRADQDARTQQAFRAMATRLRAAETERDNLLSAKAECDQERKTLADRLDALTKQAAADSQELATVKERLSQRDTENTQLQDSIQKLQQTQTRAVEFAQKCDGEKAKLSDQVIELKRKVADRETKNLALYRLANEILKRYERFGLGDALAAKEPFTGIAKVKLENLVQDYQDQIADQQVKHGH